MKKQRRRNPAGRKAERNVFTKMPFPMNGSGPRFVTVPAELTMMATDGFSNPVAHLGAASPLMADWSFERSGLTQDRERLTAMYRECAIAKRIIDMPSEDMTRGWYTLTSAMLEEADLNKLKDLEAKHSIQQEIANAIRWARLYGGALAIMIIQGHEDYMHTPLKLGDLIPGSFKGLYVADLTQGIIPSPELEDDLDEPTTGCPSTTTSRWA